MPSDAFYVVSAEHGASIQWGDKVHLLAPPDGGFGPQPGKVLLNCGRSNRELEVHSWAERSIAVSLPSTPWCSGPYAITVVRLGPRRTLTAAIPLAGPQAGASATKALTPVSPITDPTVVVPKILPPLGGGALPGTATEYCLRKRTYCYVVEGETIRTTLPGVEVCQCHLRIIATGVEYLGDDVGNDWKFRLSAVIPLLPFGMGPERGVGEHRLQHGTSERLDIVLYEQTFPTCLTGTTIPVYIQATEVDAFFDDTGSAQADIVTSPMEGTRDFVVEVPVSETVNGTARLRFTIRAEWTKVNCTRTPDQVIVTKLPDREVCVDAWYLEPCKVPVTPHVKGTATNRG